MLSWLIKLYGGIHPSCWGCIFIFKYLCNFFFLTFYSSPGSTHALWWVTVGQLSGSLFSPSGCCCTCKPAHFSPAAPTRCTRGRRTVIEGEGGIQRKKNARCLVGGRIHWHVQRQVLSSAAELKKLRIRCTRAEAALLAAGLKLIRYGIMRWGWRFVLDLQIRWRRLWSLSHICIFDTDDSDWIIIVGLYLLFFPLVAMRECLHMHLWALHCLLSPSPPRSHDAALASGVLLGRNHALSRSVTPSLQFQPTFT